MNPHFPLTYLLPPLPPLIGAFLFGGLMGLVLLKVRHRTEGRAFSLVLLSLALWQALTFLMRNSPDPSHALLYERLLIFTLFCAVAAFYFFTLQYSRTRDHRGMGAGWGLVIAAAILSSTSLLVQRIELRSYGYEPVWGPAFPLLALAGFLLSAHGTGRLYRVARTAPTYEERNQLRYILAGILAVLLGLLLDALLVLYPTGILGGLVFASATAVAVFRFHLLDIRVALREALAYVLTFLLLTFLFVPWTILLARLTGSKSNTLLQMLFYLILIGLGAGAVFLWRAIRQEIEQRFYGRRYSFQVALKNFTRQAHSIASGRELAQTLVGMVASALGVEKVYIALPSEKGFSLAACSAPHHREEWALPRGSLLVQWLEAHSAPLLATQVETEPQFQGLTAPEHFLLHKRGLELMMPLKYKGALTAILLVGRRASGEPFSPEDIALLTKTINQIAPTLHGAQVYAEQTQVAEEMARLNRLRLDFITTLAHEFKTPLTALKAAVELLEQPQGREEVRGRVIASLKHNFSRLEGMVTESLKLAQIQAAALELKREPVNVRHLVEETALALALAPVVSSKGQSIAVKAPGRLPRTSADRARLQDILFNLMGNAVKFSPPGARIEVSLHRRQGEIVVEVTDEAPSLPPQERENIFDPHHQAKKGRLGGGLGLAIAKGLVEQHGGKIWVNGGQEKGNLFGFSIPLWVSKQNRGQAE